MHTQAKPPSCSPANGNPANRKISSTSGGNARKKSTHAISGQRTPGWRTPASKLRISPPARPSGTTTSDSSTVLASPARMIFQAAPMMSRLKNVCSMVQRFQRMRVSSQRPNTTMGKNRIRYAPAPSVSGDGL